MRFRSILVALGILWLASTALASCVTPEPHPNTQVITGLVEDSAGEPAVNATVDFFIEEDDEYQLLQDLTTTTDDQGRFHSDQLAAGDYVTRITMEGYYPIYNGARSLAGATGIEVVEDEIPTSSFRVVRKLGGTVDASGSKCPVPQPSMLDNIAYYCFFPNSNRVDPNSNEPAATDFGCEVEFRIKLECSFSGLPRVELRKMFPEPDEEERRVAEPIIPISQPEFLKVVTVTDSVILATTTAQVIEKLRQSELVVHWTCKADDQSQKTVLAVVGMCDPGGRVTVPLAAGGGGVDGAQVDLYYSSALTPFVESSPSPLTEFVESESSPDSYNSAVNCPSVPYRDSTLAITTSAVVPHWTLWRHFSAGTGGVTPGPPSPPVTITPTLTTLFTSGGGRFGWAADPGCYRVVVSNLKCNNTPTTFSSPWVGVTRGHAVEDLNLVIPANCQLIESPPNE